MKKKILAMVFAAMMMVGSMTTINGGTEAPYRCITYGFWCGGFGNLDAGGGMGIACGSTSQEIAEQITEHIEDACGFGD